MKSQRKIHELDLSGTEGSPALYLDILLSDLQEQIRLVIGSNDHEREMRIGMMREYLRGVRDGNRFGKGNPLITTKEEVR